MACTWYYNAVLLTWQTKILSTPQRTEPLRHKTEGDKVRRPGCCNPPLKAVPEGVPVSFHVVDWDAFIQPIFYFRDSLLILVRIGSVLLARNRGGGCCGLASKECRPLLFVPGEVGQRAFRRPATCVANGGLCESVPARRNRSLRRLRLPFLLSQDTRRHRAKAERSGWAVVV